MKKIIDFKSLKFKLWGYFALLAAIIMVILWALQILFLQTYYQSMKSKEIEKVGEKIIAQYGKSDFEEIAYRISYNSGVIIQVFEDDGTILYQSSNMFNEQRGPKGDNSSASDLIQRITQSDDKKVSFALENSRSKSQMLIFGALIKGKDNNAIYLSINSPLAPVDVTTSVLSNQLIIVTVISLILSFVLSFFIATRLSKPISRITKTANKLAKGSYDIVFEKGGYTEINQLATSLNFATRELSKTDELRRDLIANISHDLRTPLTMVKAYAEMIRDISGENPQKRFDHTKVIIEEADRLSTLVSDILDISKMQSGTTQIHAEPFDMAEITKCIISRFDVLSEKDNYILNLNYDTNAFVLADKNKIEQVIYNLVGNAVNYTGDNKTVIISIKNIDDKVRFEVTDFGKGIPKEELEQIWERYYKSKETHKRPTVGTGLGLSIVKSILLAHNADFGVKSTVGKGSTFWFELKKATIAN